jgi:Darcynin, domain of unknown function
MTNVNHVFLMHLKTTRAWLDLPPQDRHAFTDSTIRPILVANPAVTMRYFESEAFSADVTDTAMWETNDILAYQAVVEELRETPFWDHYFEIVQILACIEDAHALHYHEDPISQV